MRNAHPCRSLYLAVSSRRGVQLALQIASLPPLALGTFTLTSPRLISHSHLSLRFSDERKGSGAVHHDHPLDAQPRTRLSTVSVPTRTPIRLLLLHPTRILLNPSSHSPPDLTVRIPHQAFKGMLVSLKTVPSHPRPLRRPLPRIAHPAHAQIGRGNIRGLSRSRWSSYDGRCRHRMGRHSHHQSHPDSRSCSGSGSRDFLPITVGISSPPPSPAFAPPHVLDNFRSPVPSLWYMLHPPHSLISISYPRIPNSCVKYPHRPVCRRTLDLSPPGLALPLSPSLFASAHALLFLGVSFLWNRLRILASSR